MLTKFEDRVKELKLALRNKNKEIAQVMSFDDFKAKSSAKANKSTSTSEETETKDKPTMHKTEFFKVVRDSLFGLYNTKSNPQRLDERIILETIGEIINSRRSSGNNRDPEKVPAEVEN
ncbi:hypothetical protein QAD02_002955 [Eretmocerus hayati]|uniref:Uncharacterized protein n=1 Tax=Eretmocerus hayati TaxID=131215 RepID=A0ACC2NM45_9HYME|nr:hypothetical protein QAD02_002955 [Eretmocerus hayati]